MTVGPLDARPQDAPEGVDVLLAEDDPDLSDIMTEVLRRGGYTTATVGNGLEALEYLRESAHPPRLVLLDLMMPVMDGWQFREEQRKDPVLARIPVVILSAGTFPETDTVEYLRKPVRAPQVLALVARYCPREGGGTG